MLDQALVITGRSSDLSRWEMFLKLPSSVKYFPDLEHFNFPLLLMYNKSQKVYRKEPGWNPAYGRSVTSFTVIRISLQVPDINNKIYKSLLASIHQGSCVRSAPGPFFLPVLQLSHQALSYSSLSGTRAGQEILKLNVLLVCLLEYVQETWHKWS